LDTNYTDLHRHKLHFHPDPSRKNVIHPISSLLVQISISFNENVSQTISEYRNFDCCRVKCEWDLKEVAGGVFFAFGDAAAAALQ